MPCALPPTVCTNHHRLSTLCTKERSGNQPRPSLLLKKASYPDLVQMPFPFHFDATFRERNRTAPFVPERRSIVVAAEAEMRGGDGGLKRRKTPCTQLASRRQHLTLRTEDNYARRVGGLAVGKRQSQRRKREESSYRSQSRPHRRGLPSSASSGARATGCWPRPRPRWGRRGRRRPGTSLLACLRCLP